MRLDYQTIMKGFLYLQQVSTNAGKKKQFLIEELHIGQM